MISLLAGSIPLIAIQLSALKVGDQVILNFVKVLDQRQLREDDAAEADNEDVDRGTWEGRVGAALMQLCDHILGIANEIAVPKLELKYKKGHVGLSVHGQFYNVVALFPKQSFIVLRCQVDDAQAWVNRLTEKQLDAVVKQGDRVHVRLTGQDMKDNEVLLRELVHEAVKLHQE